MNEYAAANLTWNESINEQGYELNTFQADQEYTLFLKLEADQDIIIAEEQISFNALGQANTFSLDGLFVPLDDYVLVMELLDAKNNLVLTTSEVIKTGIITSLEDQISSDNKMVINWVDRNRVLIQLPISDQYELKVMNLRGQTVLYRRFTDSSSDLHFQQKGLFIIHVRAANAQYAAKLFIR